MQQTNDMLVDYIFSLIQAAQTVRGVPELQIVRAGQKLQSVLKLTTCVLSPRRLETLFDCLFPNRSDQFQFEMKMLWYQYCCDTRHIPYLMLSRTYKVMHDFIRREEIAVDFQDAIREQFDRAMDDDIFSDYQDKKQNVFEMAINLINLYIHNDNLKEMLRSILAFATLEDVINLDDDFNFDCLSPCEIHRTEPSSLRAHRLDLCQIWALGSTQVSAMLEYYVSLHCCQMFLLTFRHLDLTQINDNTMRLFSRFQNFFVLPCDIVQTYVRKGSLLSRNLEIIPIEFIRGEQIRNSNSEFQREFIHREKIRNNEKLASKFTRLQQAMNSDERFRVLWDMAASLEPCLGPLESNLLLFSREEIQKIIQNLPSNKIVYYLATQFLMINIGYFRQSQVGLGRIIQDALETNYLKIWSSMDERCPFTENLSMLDFYRRNDVRNISLTSVLPTSSVLSLTRLSHNDVQLLVRDYDQIITSIGRRGEYLDSLRYEEVYYSCLTIMRYMLTFSNEIYMSIVINIVGLTIQPIEYLATDQRSCDIFQGIFSLILGDLSLMKNFIRLLLEEISHTRNVMQEQNTRIDAQDERIDDAPEPVIHHEQMGGTRTDLIN